jgi:hypothetical protein
VDFQELNKATYRDYFLLPFIDQVLDTLSGKRYFYFLDGFSGYNQIQISLETGIRPILPAAGGPMPIGFFLLVYVMPLLPFKGLSWLFSLI